MGTAGSRTIPVTARTGESPLAVEHARVVYGAKGSAQPLVAVEDVSFDVAPGEFVSIVGPSGCGKTTLLMAIAGLVKLSGGTIRFKGEPVTAPGLERAVVFQQAGLLPWRNVAANVELGLESLRLRGKERRERARQYLSLVGLRGFANAYPAQLSGGMQQRVGLARALALEPDVLLMDEPFAALDAQTRERMGAELLRIWSRDRRTVLFVTHSIDEAIFLSDRVLVMTFRPARIRSEIVIELPRPRDEATRISPATVAYRSRVWEQLSDEVLRAEKAEFEAQKNLDE